MRPISTSRFCRSSLLLAVVAIAPFLTPAQAQSLSCTSASTYPRAVRAEGAAEPLGDVVVTCTGGTPTSEGSPIPLINLQVSLNTNLTSRKLGNGNAVEALLLIDDPVAGPSNTIGSQLVASSSPNTASAPATGFGAYNGGLSGRPNVFVGQITGNNSVLFAGIPFDQPGSSGSRTLRIVNLRGDATGFASSQSPITASVSTSVGNFSLPIDSPIVAIGSVLKSLSTTVQTVNLSQCQAGTSPFKISFKELIPTAFRPLGGLNQNEPGYQPDTESMFTSTGFANTIAEGAGIATQATRLIARFSNIPANVIIQVPTQGVATSGETAALLPSPTGGSTADVSGNVTITNGSGAAVWEITQGNSELAGTIEFLATATTQTSPAPGSGTGTVVADYAPAAGTAAADTAPRFQAISASSGSIIVAPCASPLTFITAAALPGAQAGVPYSLLFQASGGVSPYTFSAQSAALPPGLNLNAQTGALTGNPTTPGSYTFNVTVSDHASLPASVARAFTLVVSGAATVTPGILPSGSIGVPYSAQLTASGFQSTPIWQIVSGALPAGLSLNTGSGAITGTPTAGGVSTFQVRALTSLQSSEPVAFSITIANPAVINPSNLPAGSIGTLYTAQLTTSGFLSTPTWQLSSGGLPPGLSLNPATGIIQGTPISNGSFTFQIRAFTDTQSAGPVSFAIGIGSQQVDFTPERLPDATLGAAYSQKLLPTGGEGNYIFTVTRGTPPAGIGLAPSGDVAGTPTQPGTFNFSVRLTSGTYLIEKQVTILVKSADLTVSPASLPDAYVLQPYSQTLSATGGLAPYQFQVISGGLPAGLVLSSAGLLSGAATNSGSFAFGVQITDATQKQSVQNFSLAVRQAVALPFTALEDATQGEPYSASFQATGGLGPFAYRVQDGTLPAGLSLSAAGSLTGSPTAAGEFRFTVQASDKNAKTASTTYALSVIPAVMITTTALPAANALVAYSGLITAVGGVAPYTWAVISGALPQGVNFAGGALAGVPAQAGIFQFDVRVTDQRGRSATQLFKLTVNAAPPLEIQGTPTAGISGQAYSFQFTVQGGTAPYRWSTSGTVPPGLTLASGTGLLSGTPNPAGNYSFVVQVTDTAGLTGSSTVALNVALPPLPALQFTGLTATSTAQSQTDFAVGIGSAFPEAINGVLRLTFQPDSGADDPAVVFANGARSLNFTIPAGSTQGAFTVPKVSLQTGTVAGLVTITTELSVNGTPLATGQPAPQTVRIAPAAPVITSFDVTRTSAGFDLTIVGLATPRQVTQLVVRLTPASGASLQTTDFTINVTAAFAAWYANSASVPFGSQFKLVLPFTLSDSTSLASVSVTLANSVGSSATVSKNY
jgi:hypothetical protein